MKANRFEQCSSAFCILIWLIHLQTLALNSTYETAAWVWQIVRPYRAWHNKLEFGLTPKLAIIQPIITPRPQYITIVIATSPTLYVISRHRWNHRPWFSECAHYVSIRTAQDSSISDANKSRLNSLRGLSGWLMQYKTSDLTDIRSNDAEKRRKLVDNIRDACMQVGFFYGSPAWAPCRELWLKPFDSEEPWNPRQCHRRCPRNGQELL